MDSVVRGIYVLDGGTLTVDSSLMVPGHNCGTPLAIPVQYFLIDTSVGFILVDTGNDPDAIDDPEGTWGPVLAAAAQPTMEPRNHPAEQLALAGVAPADVRMVIYTHLHHDHAGGARFFPQALHLVQQAEYRWAFNPDRYTALPYVASDFQHDLRWQLAEGDWVPLPGIHLVATPGHTPGHQSVVLWDTPDSGTVILAGDAIYCRENVEMDLPPGLNNDATAASASMHRLTALADATDASLIVSHDKAFFDLLPKAPEPLGRLDPEVRRFYRRGVELMYRDAAHPDRLL